MHIYWYWILLGIANIISITFTFIGLKWMYVYFIDRFAIYKRLSEDFEGIPAAKSVAILYFLLSISLSIGSILLSFYFS